MDSLDINLQVDPPFDKDIQPDRLLKVVQDTLQHANLTQGELTIVVTSDEAVQQLNQAYRQVDAPTDVLSFEANEAELSDTRFVLPPGTPSYLGDIIIAAPTAIKQAAEKQHTAFEEILLLAIHGTLHLVGYDHMTPADKETMWHIQEMILRINSLDHVVPTE